MTPDVSPPRLRAPAGLALLALALLLFGALALDLAQHGPVTGADPAISAWFRSHAQPPATQLLLAVTRLHGTLAICAMAAVLGAALAWRRQLEWLAALGLCVPGGLLLNGSVKHLFQRARPVLPDALPALPTYSFPSGHTAGATVWWGFAFALLLAHHPQLRWRIAGASAAVIMIGATAVSRVYLGEHYPSDVLAAVAEGIAWLALCFTALGWLDGRRARSRLGEIR